MVRCIHCTDTAWQTSKYVCNAEKYGLLQINLLLNLELQNKLKGKTFIED